jgi:predicted acylesterase/phospholipase RssA
MGVLTVPVEDLRRNQLCVSLLNTIRESVLTFKPSKSMSGLDEIDTTEPQVEIDVVVSGGGLKGYFMTGCSHILMHELEKQNVKIARVSGASAGAWCGLFMLTKFSTENWIETYYKCKERPGMTMHEAYEDMWPWTESHLPKDAYKICSGRLFISITEVSLFGIHNRMISEFTSNRDLYDACLASSTVPYISLSECFRRYRNMWCLDGGITNNTPVFPDRVRRQLVFRLSDVFYPIRFLINPDGKSIVV